MLKQFTSGHQKDWDAHLPLLTMAYRSAVHESTGYTPNRMMLGRELPMPSHLEFKSPELEGGREPVDYVKELEGVFLETHEVARANLRGAFRRQKEHYDRTSNHYDLSVGEEVWLFNPTRKIGVSPKLSAPWEERPYKVLSKINEVVYKIQQGKKKPRIVHVDKLKRRAVRQKDPVEQTPGPARF